MDKHEASAASAASTTQNDVAAALEKRARGGVRCCSGKATQCRKSVYVLFNGKLNVFRLPGASEGLTEGVVGPTWRPSGGANTRKIRHFGVSVRAKTGDNTYSFRRGPDT